MRPKLPELFGRLPKAKLEVVEMPEFFGAGQAAGMVCRRRSRMEAGRERVNINTYHFGRAGRWRRWRR